MVATVGLLALAPTPGPPMMASRAAGLRPALNSDYPHTLPPEGAGSAPSSEHAAARPVRPTPSKEQMASHPADPGGLRFVYFVEADQTPDPTAPERIEQQARAMQAAWHDAFGGTFTLADPVVRVVYGEHTARWYPATVNGDDPHWFRLRNIRSEARAALGLGDDEPARLFIYPAGTINGLVGANRYDDAVMDGDDLACIGTERDTVPYESEYPADCLDTALHELGHLYGLGHQGPSNGCMQLGFYRHLNGQGPCPFTEDDVAIVWSDPANLGWLSATPGDQVNVPVGD
ncbi:MAG: hypothetical protein ACK5RL_14875 [Acidimicrobiales bacterium]